MPIINRKLETEIDPEIRPLVELLNKCGLKTSACCCGHDGKQAYISFKAGENQFFMVDHRGFSIYWNFKE